MDNSNSQIVALIWNIADDVLRDVFLRGQYRDVILPMVVLRRLDALLEPTKDKVIEELERNVLDFPDEEVMKDITGLEYFNTSKWTLNKIKSQATNNPDLLLDNFNEYISGFSKNIGDVLEKFEFSNLAKKLNDKDRLLSMIEKITDPHINLTDKDITDSNGIIIPAVDNVGMGTIFEELLRRFNEENNEEAGEHFTPRDVISLLAHIVFEPVKEILPPTITLYDPACGSGGMLTECRDYLLNLGIKTEDIYLFGTEINPETYAICKSDLIIKNAGPKGINCGNTITDNVFNNWHFGYIITNPPYGKSWKVDREKIYHDKDLLDSRFKLKLRDFDCKEFEKDCTPRTSDGQLLFILEEIDKMNPLKSQPQGSRVASIHNGSSLFTGDAGSGESDIRRYLVENDLLDAIIQLPSNIFYNTGISTYVWVLTNKKFDNRKGKVQLIDASQLFEKLRKNQGQRNCTITPEYRDAILKTYTDFTDTETENISSKIFDGDDFRFYNVTIERPLRLRSKFTQTKVDDLLFDKTDIDFSKWIYQTYSKCSEPLLLLPEADLQSVKNYLNENEIVMTDKKIKSFIDHNKWIERFEMKKVAQQLMKEIGDEVFMNYNEFTKKIEKAVKKLKLTVKSSMLTNIARAMSDIDPNADPVIKRMHKINSYWIDELITTFGIEIDKLADYGFIKAAKETYIEYETDSDLRDSENIPVKDDIYEYFQREVRPYVSDAWINLPLTKIGCTISFNKYFYKPVPLRSLEENERDILELDRERQGFIQSLFNIV